MLQAHFVMHPRDRQEDEVAVGASHTEPGREPCLLVRAPASGGQGKCPTLGESQEGTSCVVDHSGSAPSGAEERLGGAGACTAGFVPGRSLGVCFLAYNSQISRSPAASSSSVNELRSLVPSAAREDGASPALHPRGRAGTGPPTPLLPL